MGRQLRVTASTGNVFRDLGFRREEAEHLLVRADLMIQAQKLIAARQLKQRATAEILRVSERSPRRAFFAMAAPSDDSRHARLQAAVGAANAALSGGALARQPTSTLSWAGRRVSYSINSSARSSTDRGIVSPSAFAVWRLMTNSNFVGCSTGRSAGLAPFRIRSTYTAPRR